VVGVFVISGLSTAIFGLDAFLFLVPGAMSVGMLMTVLNELRASKSGFGQYLIFLSSIGEFLTIILLMGAHLYFHYRAINLQFVFAFGKLMAVFSIAYMLLVLLRTLLWWFPKIFARLTIIQDPAEMGVRAGLALMLAFSGISSLWGIEPFIGAFLAGALFSFVFRHKGVLETKISSIGFGFFVPFFFISVGINFNLTVLFDTSIYVIVLILFVITVLSKLIPTLFLYLRGFTFRQSTSTGFILCAPLTLLIAIGEIGADIKAIDSQTNTAVVMLAIITGILFPWLFRILYRRDVV